jgi:hypothetical protein
MRLYPVVSSGTIRITHKPMQLGPYSLPAGQPVLIPFFSIHRSLRLWDDPDAFKPERWLAADAAAVAAEVGAAGSREAGADGQAAAAEAAGLAPEAEDEDYVDVAADINAMRDQAPQQQQQQQQGVKDSKQQMGSSHGDAQQQQQQQPAVPAAAAAAAAAKAGGGGLEIKV